MCVYDVTDTCSTKNILLFYYSLEYHIYSFLSYFFGLVAHDNFEAFKQIGLVKVDNFFVLRKYDAFSFLHFVCFFSQAAVVSYF